MEDKRIYDVKLEDWQEGVFATSFVDNPAIMSDFVFFSKEQNIMFFANEEKREVVGAIMIPDLLMPRKDENGDVFYVRFSKEVIYSLNERMKEFGYDKSFTFAHSYDATGNVKLLESWIKEFDEDKSNAYGFDLPVGTMFMKVKVEEDTLWNLVKEKKLKGFSIELNASYVLNKKEEEQKMSKLDLFERNLDVNDVKLAWDGDESITSDTILFQVVTETVDEKEVEKVQKFSGKFELNEKIFKSENGIVTVEEKAPEAPEETEEEVKDVFDVEGFLTKVGELMDEKINALKEDFSTKNTEISESLEEVKLFQKQSGVKKEKQQEKKDNFEAVTTIKENAEVFKNWRK
jgi:hypothetical protein